MSTRKATLVGTGLIGGSLGLALKRAGWEVVGTDRDPERAAAAVARKMGKLRTELRYYHLVPEWITGMGIVVGQGE